MKNEGLKKATLNFIASQLQENEIGELKDMFLKIDVNHDGTLTLQELREGISKVDSQLAQDIENLFKSMDVDGSGTIDYTEFIAATMERSIYLVFDTDGSGKISAEELKQVLGREEFSYQSANFWSEVIQEADYNGDGEVDFDEFLKMMYKKNNSTSAEN